MSLDVVIYHRGQPWAEPKLDAFAVGLRAHGIEPEERRSEDWRVSDLAVVWAHRDAALHDLQSAAGNHYLVLERSYIGDIHRRRRWTSIGFDGLNGRADFCNDGDVLWERWDRHFGRLMLPERDFRTPPPVGLIIGQVPGDAALVGVDIDAWYRAATDDVQRAGLDAEFRPHPNDIAGCRKLGITAQEPLSRTLDRVSVVMTWNSSAAIDAVLAAVQTVAVDRGSMAWDVAAHSIEQVPFYSDRLAWASRLAYAQWLDDEIIAGHAWDHLKRKFD